MVKGLTVDCAMRLLSSPVDKGDIIANSHEGGTDVTPADPLCGTVVREWSEQEYAAGRLLTSRLIGG